MSVIAKIASLSHRDRITSVGYALTGVWLFLVALFWMLAPGGEGGGGGVARLMTVVGVALPLVLIWLAVTLARSIAVLRAEAADLRAVIADMRGDAPEDHVSGDRASGDRIPEPPQKPLHGGVAPATPRNAPAAAPARSRLPEPPRQPVMALDDPQGEAVDAATLIRALNFPDGPDDHEAIDALRQALRDPSQSRVLRSAQDVVTLLAGRDIYMDDLPPDTAHADAWRRFAAGERGSAVASLGAIHDEETLQEIAAMMQGDEVFKDTAHHFLRHFDGLLTRLIPELDDLQIAVMADSRSGRAFMLLGRVGGAFG
ncbi:hypothetical protein Q4511_04470 [Paracoccus sp. 1_MG-2023]|uniref:hypothetical protein n=1 Tax=unclassified Paracoccus (in: a-proteobacteria) TaxID=2688777 RepID=UPI001C0A61A8|nr:MULTISPECIES: hypothetical protein [unclassified Paracoccus (in: a-proteobacteria)]MBU2956971.1 hypothetical protein [Paracoccus sp. C2R09]MDO6668168.1 hypothetical protein [Paracoccus sp. 1_MG-2023]